MNNFFSTFGINTGLLPIMRRTAKSKKTDPKLKLVIRDQPLHLPKHIRDNIRHPLLRLAWFQELHPTG